MTNSANTPSDFWIVRYTTGKHTRSIVVYGVTCDDAILKANETLNRDGGYGMRRLTFFQVAEYLNDILAQSRN